MSGKSDEPLTGVSNFAKYYPISIVFYFVLNYWQSKTFTFKQRREKVGNEKIGNVREMGGKERGRGTWRDALHGKQEMEGKWMKFEGAEE